MITMNIKQYDQLVLISWLLMLTCYLSCSAYGININTHNHNNNIMCNERERDALLRFKHSIRVDSCELLSSWGDRVDNKNCCQWHGVHCNNNTGHVIVLDLRGVVDDGYGSNEMCLQGKVSSSLADLKHLIYLDLSLNYFEDQPIPSFIGYLVNLKYLNLSTSGFQGEIPQQLGNLSSLTSLDLSGNFVHEVGQLLWLSRLTLLRTINLGVVNLSKATNWLQVVNNLPLLFVLNLNQCDLPQPVVSKKLSYKNSSTTLSVLNLSRNYGFNSSLIFEWLFNRTGINTHLAHLDLSHNQLGGPLPSAFEHLHAITYLDLSSNTLQGKIPSSFGSDNMQSLSYLDLSSNSLQGEIPSFFANMQSLSYLSLSDNQLKGPIPNIKSLTHLDLSLNNFIPLPQTFDNLCSLQYLNMYGNDLTDELPNILQTLGGCAKISMLSLDLSSNHISGPIPDSIGTFSSLKELKLGSNRLNGTVSQRLGQLSMMDSLDLSGNYIKDTLSNIHFSNLSKLRELDLSYNTLLAINISLDWIPPFQLDTIRLSNCRLGPRFPKWLLSQTNYSYLDISNAGISDSIPETLWSLLPSKLVYLSLSHNMIHGTLPESTLQNTLLYSTFVDIDLSFNNIEGVIPSFPSNVTSLHLDNNRFLNPIPFLCPKSKQALLNVDLSNNLLSSELPDCWFNFDQLSILHLENNNLSGVIPSSMAYLTRLKVFHLRNNTIVGGIKSLENLTSLVVLHLGYNSMDGNIPPFIGNSFTKLSILSLRSNKFDGEIPISLCQLSFLQILDLSSNHIIGTIPRCVYNFTAMQAEEDLMPELDYHDLKHHYYSTYNDFATIMWKRKERSFAVSLGLVKAIDFSNNKLGGKLPIEISYLKGLISLDISRNNLVGGITQNIGQLTTLEVLDLSNNQFSGAIPASLADLNSLGILDLSSNQLSGEIPHIPQLQRFDASAFEGNPALCGQPLPNCPNDQLPRDNSVHEKNFINQDKIDNEDNFIGLYVSVVLGFIIGFWGVCGTLALKKSWRDAFFQFIDSAKDKLYIVVSLNMERVRRRQ